MNKTLPDKYIRKAVYNAINNITVDGVKIPCYDSYETTRVEKNAYVLLSTQTNTVSKTNKCEYQWESSILIDIVTKYKRPGKTGSRLFADNICDEIRRLTDALTLDVASNLTVVWQIQSFPNDLTSMGENETVFRKFIRIEMLLN